MSHLYNRSGVPAYGMDPERAGPASPDRRQPGGHSSPARAGRATSYVIVLMAGVIMLLGLMVLNKPRVNTGASSLVAPRCDCPKLDLPTAPDVQRLSVDDADAELRGGGSDGQGRFEGLAGRGMRDATKPIKPFKPHQIHWGASQRIPPEPPIGGEILATATPVPVPAPPPFVQRALRSTELKSILITGAAGFIGSHFALLLLDKGGFKITAIDDMSRASWDTVLRLQALAKEAANSDFEFHKQVRR
jgi:hypothetical protein